jgi:hypothetical protein
MSNGTHTESLHEGVTPAGHRGGSSGTGAQFGGKTGAQLGGKTGDRIGGETGDRIGGKSGGGGSSLRVKRSTFHEGVASTWSETR